MEYFPVYKEPVWSSYNYSIDKMPPGGAAWLCQIVNLMDWLFAKIKVQAFAEKRSSFAKHQPGATRQNFLAT